MRCIINGQTEELPDGCTIADCLRERHLDRGACAVEVNQTLVPKAGHAEHALRDGDRIEIVTLVGGG
ncbi:MAG: sulfur carrier protein ThiS [Phycisphaerales bacterium]